jgi:hypothetical protein
MAWTWRLEDADGATLSASTAPTVPAHASQADAESWLGESWRELREAGVAQVTLLDAGSVVYGPMSLSDE